MTSIRFTSFPLTSRPPHFVDDIVAIFRRHEHAIATTGRPDKHHLKSNDVLRLIGDDLEAIGFTTERGKESDQKIDRPVFFGEDGRPTLRYEVDAYHPAWRCGLEVEATRGIRGGAVYRDLIQALVMVDVDHLCLAVVNEIVYGKNKYKAKDYIDTCRVATALYGHQRITFPYRLTVIGY